MTKNGLKWPKFGTFIVIKWFYEKIEKKNSRQFLRGAILHLPRKNNQIQAFSTLKAVFSKNAQKNRSQAQLIPIIPNLVCEHPIWTSKT